MFLKVSGGYITKHLDVHKRIIHWPAISRALRNCLGVIYCRTTWFAADNPGVERRSERGVERRFAMGEAAGVKSARYANVRVKGWIYYNTTSCQRVRG